MRRRDLLRLLLSTPALALADLDVERLLWVPKPMVVVPAMPALLSEREAMLRMMTVAGEAHADLMDRMVLAALCPKSRFTIHDPRG